MGIWRYSHIITRFTVFSLIWGVCGGWWMAIYPTFSFLISCIGSLKDARADSGLCRDYEYFPYILSAISSFPGVFGPPTKDGMMLIYMIRWLENLIGYVLIAIFASVKFSCLICADENLRQFGQNETIDRLFDIGCSLVLIVEMQRHICRSRRLELFELSEDQIV